MQKHSDRPDKRPPVGMNQGGVPGANAGPVGHGGGGHGVGGQNNIGGQAATATSAAAAAGLPGLAGSAADAYWPKMDPYGVAAMSHERDYGLMDPRLNPHHRDMVDPRHQVHDIDAAIERCCTSIHLRYQIDSYQFQRFISQTARHGRGGRRHLRRHERQWSRRRVRQVFGGSGGSGLVRVQPDSGGGSGLHAEQLRVRFHAQLEKLFRLRPACVSKAPQSGMCTRMSGFVRVIHILSNFLCCNSRWASSPSRAQRRTASRIS